MSENKKVIFIDRDGVINKDPGGWTEHSYVTRPEDFIFLPRAPEAIKKLNEAGYDIIVISNQGGVSKGFYSKEELEAVNSKMLQGIKKAGADIKKVYYCPHQSSDNCDCRKPGTGMFRRAEKELGIKAEGNFFIGDGKADVEAARRMGLKSVFVLSGKTTPEEMRLWSAKPDYIFDDLFEAVNFIVKKGVKE